MSLDAVRRKKATITVTVAHQSRRFILRAHSVAQHLEQLDLQQQAREAALAEVREAGESQATAARAELAATLEAVTELLQEPADRGEPLTFEESWLLDIEDPSRVLALQRELTNAAGALGASKDVGEAPSMAALVDDWLDIGTTIARAGLAPEPHHPLNEWSLAQVVQTYHRACRELWRETAMRIRLAGGDPGVEPDFSGRGRDGSTKGGLDSATFTVADEERYAKWKADFEAQLNASPTPVFPDKMDRVQKQALNDAAFDKMKADHRAAHTDPDGRKFPGYL